MAEAGAEPALSVVIPTYNRRDSLRAVLVALGTQSFALDRVEVLVISDGSTDGTRALCNELTTPYTLRFFEQENAGPAAARNLGVREARAPLLVFLDDDVVPERTLLAEHAALHAREADAVAIGPLLPPPGTRLQPWVYWEEKVLLKQYDEMQRGVYAPTYRQFYTGNASVPRAAVQAVGGFDPTYRRAEDVEMAYRLHAAGQRFFFVPEAHGLHYARRSYASWLAIPYAYGRNDVLMSQRPGCEYILRNIGEEFYFRHPSIRALARLTVGRGAVRTACVRGFGAVAGLVARLPLARSYDLAGYAYSVVFNVQYWHGVSSLIGTQRFWEVVARHVPAGSVRRREPPRPRA